jgi:tetratricopeptide (TPR) repeat protein
MERAKYPGQLFITEEYHFTERIANLQQDSTTSAIKDIQYTLMAWPNHHGALFSAFQFRKKARGEWPQDANSATPVECHLMRAINFSPKDPVPYMIQGMLLHDFGRYEEALASFRKANKLMPNDVITHYNMGLTMVVLKMYEEAVKVAEEVYSTDFPLPGLKNQLTAAGYWPPGQKPAPQNETGEESGENTLPGEMEPPPPSGMKESVSAIDQRVDSTVVRH